MNANEQSAANGKKSDKYYSVRISCSNCSFSQTVDVLKGTVWRDVTQNLMCKNCEVGKQGCWIRSDHYWRTED